MSDKLIEIIPSLLWYLLALGFLLRYRREIARAINECADRINSGSAFEIFSIKFQENITNNDVGISDTIGKNLHKQSAPQELQEERKRRKSVYHDIFLVHKLAPSKEKNQKYDILIHLSTKDKDLRRVRKVEYYFGPYWHEVMYSTEDYHSDFSIATSAYGAFLCIARVTLDDGTTFILERFIDFEMGEIFKTRKAK